MSKIEVGSPEWLELRKKYITATDLPVIMGVSKWKKIEELYVDKTTDSPPMITNAWMRRGIDLEPEARQIFENRFARLVDPQWVVSPEIEWAAASLDGWDGDETLVEIKCPGKKDHDGAKEGKIPAHYYPQIQWQMMVTMQKKAWYVSYRPEDINHFIAIPVERDQDYIDEMIEKAAEFYSCVKNRTPPQRKNSNTTQETVVLTDESSQVLEEELNQLLSRRKEDEERIEVIKQQLIKRCNGKKGQGQFLTLTPIEAKGTIQYDKIPQLQAVDLNSYRKPNIIRWRVDQIRANH